MLIEKQENGWSFADENYIGLWYLAYTDDKVIAVFLQSEKAISTSVNLFAGSQEECEQYIIDNELVYELTTNDNAVVDTKDGVGCEIAAIDEVIPGIDDTLTELNSPDTVPIIEEVINI